MDQGADFELGVDGAEYTVNDRASGGNGNGLPAFHGRLPNGKIVRTSTREWRDYKRTRTGAQQSGEGEAQKPVGVGEGPPLTRKGKTVAPPPIDAPESKTPAARARKGKADAAACGAFVGAVFGGFSIAVSGRFVPGLIASTDEEAEIGKALALCLDTLPTPVGEAVSKGGPWLNLGAKLGGAVLNRMKVMQEANLRAMQKLTVVPPAAAQGAPFAGTTGGIEAPDPSKVNPPQPQPSPFEVRAPAPQVAV